MHRTDQVLPESAPAHCSANSAGGQGGARHSHPIASLPCSTPTTYLPCSLKHVALYLSLATEIHPLKPGQKLQNARRTFVRRALEHSGLQGARTGVPKALLPAPCSCLPSLSRFAPPLFQGRSPVKVARVECAPRRGACITYINSCVRTHMSNRSRSARSAVESRRGVGLAKDGALSPTSGPDAEGMLPPRAWRAYRRRSPAALRTTCRVSL